MHDTKKAVAQQVRSVPKFTARRVRPLAVAFVMETEYGTLLYSSQEIDQAEVILNNMDMPAKYAGFSPTPVMIAAVLLGPTIHNVAVEDMPELLDSGLMVPGRVWSRIINERKQGPLPNKVGPISIRAGASRVRGGRGKTGGDV